MPLSDDSKLNISFKRLLGRAHTDNAKRLSNEVERSSSDMVVGALLALSPPPAPSRVALYDITPDPATNRQAVEFVRLVLTPDPTSNGHAFFAALPGSYSVSTSNALGGTSPFTNGAVIKDFLDLQLASPFYGPAYEAIPFVGGSDVQGSGDLIPPGDARNWLFDYFSGIFYQEDASAPAPSYIECILNIAPQLVSDIQRTTSTPFYLSQSFGGPTANLLIGPSRVIDFIGAEKVASPVGGATPDTVLSTADFQTGTTAGEAFSFTLPVTTLGEFRRAALGWDGTSLNVYFTPPVVLEGSLADPQSVVPGGEKFLGWVDLEGTGGIAHKTIGSVGNVIEANVVGVARIHNVEGKATLVKKFDVTYTALPIFPVAHLLLGVPHLVTLQHEEVASSGEFTSLDPQSFLTWDSVSFYDAVNALGALTVGATNRLRLMAFIF